MRTEAEVREMLETFQRHSKCASDEMDKGGIREDRFDELADIFIGNSRYISCLEWVLGGDTIRVTNGNH